MAKQADGRYRTRVTVGRRADGTSIVKYVSGRTRKELEAHKQELLRRYVTGVTAADQHLLAMDYIERYYQTKCAPRRKAATVRDQESQIRRYVEPWLHGRQLRAINSFDLAEVLNGCRDRCATIVSFVSGLLKGAFAEAYAQGLIDRNPAADLKADRRPKEKRRALTDDERAAMDALIAEQDDVALLAGLLYYTGLRRGEALGIQWADVDMRADLIHVRRDVDYKLGDVDGLKTPAARRDVPICPQLKELLQAHRGVGAAYILHGEDPGHWMHETTFRRRWDLIRARVAPELTAHYLRHNYATVLYDAGIDVLAASRIMGHADPSVTMKIYIEIERLRKVEQGIGAARAAFDPKVQETAKGPVE